MNTADRIKKLLRDNNVPERRIRSELSRVCKISQQAVGDWFKGKTRRISPEYIKLIADEWGSSADYLIAGAKTETVYLRESSAPKYSSSDVGKVPLISWVQAGDWAEAIDNFAPGDAERYLPCPKKHSASTYALKVQGDSMTAPHGRSYPEGCIIFVDPELRGSVSLGDRVVAKLNGHDAVTFKQLAADGNKQYLKPLNPQHSPIFDEFRILGKVIGMWVDE